MTNTSDPAPKKLWNISAIGLICLGLTCSGYLLWRHFTLTAGEHTHSFNVCTAVFGSNCDESLRSEWSVALGIPLAGWGLVHFSMLATLLMLSGLIGSSFQRIGTLAGLFLSSVGVLAGIGLTGMMLSGMTALCPLCVVVHATNLLLFPVLKAASGATWRELGVWLGDGVGYALGTPAQNVELARWKVSGLVFTLLVGAMVYQWVLIQSDRRELTGGVECRTGC